MEKNKKLNETLENMGFSIEDIINGNEKAKAKAVEPQLAIPQEPSKSIPISMRLEENLIEGLKEAARTLSFEKNQDISYIDLIKKAAKEVYDKINKEKKEAAPMTYSVPDRLKNIEGEWVDAVNIDRILGPVPESIKALKTAHSKVSDFFKHSIARRFLEVLDISETEKFKSPLKASVKAHVLSRRGAVPDSSTDFPDGIFPTFEIACRPMFPISSFLSGQYKKINECINNGFSAILREEECNFLASMRSVAEDNHKHTKVKKITPERIKKVADLHTKNGQLIMGNALMHPLMFLKLKNEDMPKDIKNMPTDWRFEDIFPLTLDGLRYCGSLFGCNIVLSDACRRNEIVFTYDKFNNGTFASKINPIMFACHDLPKLKMGFVGFEEIGMVIKDGCCSVLEEE